MLVAIGTVSASRSSLAKQDLVALNESSSSYSSLIIYFVNP